MKRILGLGLGIGLLLAPLVSFAETVTTLKFEFTKRPPRAIVAYYEDDKGPLPESVPQNVDQKDKQFVDMVVFGKKGQTIKLKNSDTVDHNIYARDKDAGVEFDIGLAPPGTALDKKVDWGEGKFVKIGCKIHPKMRAWVGSVDVAHIASIEPEKKQKSVELILADVPKKAKKLRVWMPGYDEVSLELVPGGKAVAEMVRKGKPRGKVSVSRAEK